MLKSEKGENMKKNIKKSIRYGLTNTLESSIINFLVQVQKTKHHQIEKYRESTEKAENPSIFRCLYLLKNHTKFFYKYFHSVDIWLWDG